MSKVKISANEAESLVKKVIEFIVADLESKDQDVLGNLVTIMLSATCSVIISNSPNAKEAQYMLEKFIERLEKGTIDGIKIFKLT